MANASSVVPKVGADPDLLGTTTWIEMNKTLSESGIALKSLRPNLIDVVWTEDDGRPAYQVMPYIPWV